MNEDLTSEQRAALKALQKLKAGYKPCAQTGGFDADDISMHCGLEANSIQLICWDLERLGFVKEHESPAESPWLSHWILTQEGEAAI